MVDREHRRDDCDRRSLERVCRVDSSSSRESSVLLFSSIFRRFADSYLLSFQVGNAAEHVTAVVVSIKDK